MAKFFKAGAALVGIAGACLLGVGIIAYMNQEPTAKVIGADKFDEKYTDEKALAKKEDNKDKLVANIEDNKAWWEWTYKNKFEVLKTDEEKKTLDDAFKKATKAYDEKDGLNKVCEDMYKKDKEAFKGEDKTNLKNNIKTFCTIGNSQELTFPTE